MKDLIRKILKENNQEEIDRILDKINDVGMNSLTRSERMTLSNSDVNNYSSNDELISSILLKTDECGYITTNDLQMNSISFKEMNGEIHLIDAFHSDGVNVVVYGGYKYETEMGEYEIPYDKLDTNILEEILSNIEDYVCED